MLVRRRDFGRNASREFAEALDAVGRIIGAEIQEFRELMAALGLRRALVHLVTQIPVPNPAQQECGAYGMSQFLKRHGERIAAAVAVDSRKHG